MKPMSNQSGPIFAVLSTSDIFKAMIVPMLV